MGGPLDGRVFDHPNAPPALYFPYAPPVSFVTVPDEPVLTFREHLYERGRVPVDTASGVPTGWRYYFVR